MSNNTRLAIIGLITLVCVWLIVPTVKYFSAAASLTKESTPAQRAEVAKMLKEGGVISLGLDLQGGADFLLAVDTDRHVRREMEHHVDQMRRALQKDSVDATVALNADAKTIRFKLNKVEGKNFAADVLKQYAGIYEFTNFQLDSLETTAQTEGILRLTKNEERALLENAFQGALKVITQRVDNLGLTNPLVVRQGADRIRVRIPGQTDPKLVRETILKAAELEFRMLHPDHDTIVRDFAKPELGGSGDARFPIIRDDLMEEVVVPETGATMKQLKKDIPNVPAGYKIALGEYRKVDPGSGKLLEKIDNIVYVVSEKVDLSGAELARASMGVNYMSALEDPVYVNLEFNREGSRKFKDITTNNVGRRFAVLLDNVVYTAPVIREAIAGGRAQITGGFSQAEAGDLSSILRAGALKAPLRVIEDSNVGPTLGAESIRDSAKALIYGSIFLVAFMIFVYRISGVIACVAMVLNVSVLLGFLAISGASLTLSGIGGILLTMGMAVDANVLIYERLREELKSKPPRAAINAAFSRAWTVILDSNITSLLPAVVLVAFEVVSGSVKGFWFTLAVGLVANLYTGLAVTRALVEWYYDRTKSIGVGTIQFLPNANVNWVGMRKLGLIVTGALTIASIAVIGSGKMNLGIDFRGGSIAQVRADGQSVEQMREMFEGRFKDVQVVSILNSPNFMVTVAAEKGAETDVTKARTEIETLFAQKFGPANSEGLFGGKAQILSTSSIDPQIGSEFLSNAIFMVVVTSIIIMGYLGLRFQYYFGVAAGLALLHDVFLTLGVFVLLGKPVTMDIVSALLIILGYSVNDTIVVFDRIREEMGDHPGANLTRLFNDAINRTLGRTMFTGVTVLITLFSLYFFGGAALSDFALTLIIGIVFGTYSSIFVASMLAYFWMRKKYGDTNTITQPKAATVQAAPPSTLGATR